MTLFTPLLFYLCIIGVILIVGFSLQEQAKKKLILKLIDSHQFENALTMLQHWQEVRPNEIFINFHIGLCLTKLKKHKEALRYLSKARKSHSGWNKNNITIRRIIETMIECYLQTNLLDQATKELVSLFKTYPDNSHYSQQLGEILFLQNHFNQSQLYCLRSLQAGNNNYKNYLYLGIIAHRQNKTNEAINNLNASLKYNSNNKTAHLYLGMIHFHKKHYQQASKHFECGQTDASIYGECAYYQALINVQEKKNKKAISLLTETLSKDIPISGETLSQIRWLLSSLYEQEKQFQQAFAQWKAMEREDPKNQKISRKIEIYSQIIQNPALQQFMSVSKKMFDLLCSNIIRNTFKCQIQTVLSLPSEESKFQAVVLNSHRATCLAVFYRTTNTFQEEAVRKLHNEIKNTKLCKAFLLTTSKFTSKAKEYVRERPIELYDATMLGNFIKQIL